MNTTLKGRVAIVTGAGSGLGRAHALALASYGARVVVNDLGADRAGAAAQSVVKEIQAQGGVAMVDGGDVTDASAMQAMVERACEAWGQVDILVNNAGILRDKSFAKLSLEDFRQVVEVHLMGAVNCTKAVWDKMRAQRYGRIVMTTSSSGLYGNFGQSNYGAAKMALVGLMQTLGLEGEKYDIRVNCLAPTAATAMTEGLMSENALAALRPEAVSPGLVALVGTQAPNRSILLAGAGCFESAHITMTQGVFLGGEGDLAAAVEASFADIQHRTGETIPHSAFAQAQLELSKAGMDISASSFGQAATRS
ncbi:SDR family NAD(P)-dependent oxidoreductase [Pseudomonas aeruginosa]|jgi:NAD(P)-dependent dehydrogenase (short-subunit alcohol dehydrogenase family)|uniref:SDR family NAD(P)-dependent oxidoreductase n=1 Tax=Pseudomonas aeruginosa TaxID=287 RepID=UPI000BA0ACE9|nr:SDR family NAD(P)-dependent oxidoreductase [Pseudomonas aeruginosa]EIU1321629.1 SDR family NAD(P)-dependent oxidoreductase [Pseudomonas aeruginosa]ELY3880525.1 SDR family NAD(P)-dependent oxidoreductase [Pseudomonas aeruginosa]MCO2110209.1 SDR family NAD(P)-dependent oxidoreductase [Pseudomonas aeruginosa]MDV8060220.1 SDR family NAD(P)-dependent oxidoreductase [Pseudomonas aeruginosa]MDV8087997.1 SDR family NAD(P)-dependent oxidoreductase [Pseudomonas aeruginosa]